MQKNVTIKSIAEELNLNLSTVSRVLNGYGEKYRISSKTIEAVRQTAETLNYTPNNIAKSLRLKKSSTIGLVVPDISNPWFSTIALEVEKKCRKNEYNVILCNSGDDVKTEKRSLSLLQNWMVDGFIIAPTGIEYKHLVSLKKKGVPLVLIDRFFENADLPFVSTNDFAGAVAANEYLIKNGHKKIACIQGIENTSPNIQRVNGYKQALINHKIGVKQELIYGNDFSFQNGYHCTKQLVKGLAKSKVTAVFSAGNQISLGILKALKEENIKVPSDLSIVSFDDHNYLELLYTPLTTVSHMNENLGQRALALLFGIIEEGYSKEIATGYLLPTKLVIRESVKDIKI